MGVSIPSLSRQRWKFRRILPLAVWVLQLVTGLAQRLELTLASVWVKHAQSEVWTVPQVLNVMHDAALAKPSVDFAVLALEMVQAQHFRADSPPLRPRVELSLLARRKESHKLRQSAGRYAGYWPLDAHGLSPPGKTKRPEPTNTLSREFLSAPVFTTSASSNIHDEPVLALPAVQRLPRALHIRRDLLEAVAPSLPQAVRAHRISINHWKQCTAFLI